MLEFEQPLDKSVTKRSSKKILKLRKKTHENEYPDEEENTENCNFSYFHMKDQQSKKHVRFRELLESIDRLSVIDENYEEFEVNSEAEGQTINNENYSKRNSDCYSNSSIFDSLNINKELRESKNIQNCNSDEQITISKHELVMVLKENEILKKRTSAHKIIINEMRGKLGIVKQLIDDSEQQREIGLKHINKLRREATELRKIFNKEKCFKENEDNQKLFEQMKILLQDAQNEIVRLKKMIGKISYENVNQCAQLGKEVISLQLKLDRQKSEINKQERERSFSRTIEKATSETASINDNKSNFSTPYQQIVIRSCSRGNKKQFRDSNTNIDNSNRKSSAQKFDVKKINIPKSKVQVKKSAMNRGRKAVPIPKLRKELEEVISSDREHFSVSDSKANQNSSKISITDKEFEKLQNLSMYNDNKQLLENSSRNNQTDFSDNTTGDLKHYEN